MFPSHDRGGGRASGGPVSSRRAYMVGERGPELFVPSYSGNIVPNHELAGGDTFNITIDAPGADFGVEARIQRGVEQAVAISAQRRRDAKRRGR